MLEPARMPTAARTELDPGATCRNCGQPLAPGSSVCGGCGAAHGEANRCPHCNSVADVETHPALGFRCLVCGGPRVALDIQDVTPSAQTQALLKAAGSEQTQHVMYSAAGFMLAGMGLLALLVATAVIASASPGVAATLSIYLAATVPLATGIFALRRAATARQLRGAALSAAQVSALGDVQAVTGVLDAERAARLLRIAPERAELLLAEASISALLEQAPAPRLRVEIAAPTLSDSGAGEAAATEPGEPVAKTLHGDPEN